MLLLYMDNSAYPKGTKIQSLNKNKTFISRKKH